MEEYFIFENLRARLCLKGFLSCQGEPLSPVPVGQEEDITFVLDNKWTHVRLISRFYNLTLTSKGSMRSELFYIVQDFVQRTQSRTQTGICWNSSNLVPKINFIAWSLSDDGITML